MPLRAERYPASAISELRTRTVVDGARVPRRASDPGDLAVVQASDLAGITNEAGSVLAFF